MKTLTLSIQSRLWLIRQHWDFFCAYTRSAVTVSQNTAGEYQYTLPADDALEVASFVSDVMGRENVNLS